MKITPRLLRLLLNLYPPYLGAGIRVDAISRDWKETRVSMRLRWYNRNIVSTHFGGSLSSMVDPHLMLMLMNLLGPDYIVWDKSAHIDFLRPGKGTVSATFVIADDELQTIRDKTAGGDKYLPKFTLAIVDDRGKTVARVEKILFVRLKDRAVGAPATNR